MSGVWAISPAAVSKTAAAQMVLLRFLPLMQVCSHWDSGVLACNAILEGMDRQGHVATGRLGTEIWSVAKLAAPVALAELGWMAMTTVDTIMVGRLGASAIGAIGIGSNAFYSFAIFGM